MRSISEFIISMRDNDEKGVVFFNDTGKYDFLSYKNLYHASLKMLFVLQNLGIKKGDNFIFQIEDNREMIICFWTCIFGGIIPIPLTMGNSREQIKKLGSVYHLIDISKIITNKKYKEFLESQYKTEKLEEEFGEIIDHMLLIEDLVTSQTQQDGILEPGCDDDTAFIQFSSGSTDMAKGVILSHHGIIVNLEDITERSNLLSSDFMQSWLPLTHDMGLIGFHLLPCFNKMNSMIMKTSIFMNDPIQWMEACSKYKATHIASPNFGYRHFLSKYDDFKDYGWDLSSVKIIFNGAESVDANLAAEFMNRLSKYGLYQLAMYPVYGMAEACIAFTFPQPGTPVKYLVLNRKKISVGCEVALLLEDDPEGARFVNNGYPLRRMEIHILDDNYEKLGQGKVGYIYMSGENVTKGYYNNEKYTKENIMENGWVNTGDIGFIYDGGLYITGRKKEIIIINGYNYYSSDIERILENLHFEKKREYIVNAVNSPTDHQEQLAVFVAYDGSLEDFVDISDQIKSELYKNSGIIPGYVIPVERIYKTSSGKKKRYTYAREFLEGKYDAVLEQLRVLKQARALKQVQAEEAEDIIVVQTIQIVKEELRLQELELDEYLTNLGITSLETSRIQTRINQVMHKNIAISDLYELPTVRMMINFLKNMDKPAEGISRKEVLLTRDILENLTQRSREIGVSCYDLLYGSYIYVQMFLKDCKTAKVLLKHTRKENRECIICIDDVKNEQGLYMSMADQWSDINQLEEMICDNIICGVQIESEKPKVSFDFGYHFEDGYINNFINNYKKALQIG
ncbi:MAG: AMP-binding protein [Ruminiclostridium sp.]